MEHADPKELQNDGDPIKAHREVWQMCQKCGCRHSLHEFCPSPEQAEKRRFEDLRSSRC